jgi:hypothetical protein
VKEILAAWGPTLGVGLGLLLIVIMHKVIDIRQEYRRERERVAEQKAKRRQQEMLLKLLETMAPEEVVRVMCDRMEFLHYYPGTKRMRDLTAEEAQEFEDTYQVCYAALRMLRDRDGSTV